MILTVGAGLGAAAPWANAQGRGPEEVAKLISPDPDDRDYFGGAVALDGDRAIIGEYGDYLYRGVVHIFTGSGANWVPQARILPNTADIPDNVGWAVDIDGDTIVFGTYRDGIQGKNNAGSAYRYLWNGNRWAVEAKLTSPDYKRPGGPRL